MHNKYIFCPYCGTKNSVTNIYCKHCGQILPELNDDSFSNDSKSTSDNSESSITDDILDYFMSGIDDVDSINNSYSNNSQYSSNSSDFNSNYIKENTNNKRAINNKSSRFSNNIHMSDNSDNYINSKAHSFKHWWESISKRSRFGIIIVVFAIAFMIVVNIGGSGTSDTSNNGPKQSASEEQDSVTAVANRLRKRTNDNGIDTMLTLDKVTPKSNHIDIEISDNASQNEAENAWDNVYDNNNNSIPIHFIDDTNGGEVATGYSNSDTITWNN